MARRRLNVRLLLLLVVGTILLGAGVHVLHGFQVRRNAKGLLVRATQAEAEGQIDKAEGYYKRYLVFRPEDVEALVRYARLLEGPDGSPGGRARSLPVYKKIVRLDGERSDIRRKLMDLAIQAGQFPDAQVQVEYLLHASPEDGELTYLLGRCEEAAGRSREAADRYEKARTLDPTRVEAYTRLADLLRLRLGDADRADRVMDARKDQDGLIAHNGRSAAAYLARARYRTRFPTPGIDAGGDVARALELAPDDADVLLAAATAARDKGDLAAARTHLRHGLERDPRNHDLYRAIAELELQANHPEESLSWLRKGIESQPEGKEAERVVLSLTLADELIRLGKADEADRVIAKLRGGGARPEILDFLEATALVARGQWARGAKALQEVYPLLASSPDSKELTKRCLVQLGRCYEQLGNVDQRYDAYQKAVAINLDPDPLWVVSRLGLAAALVDLNRIDAALEQYRVVMAREPGAGLVLARLQIVQNLRRAPEEQRWEEVEQTLGTIERGLSEAQKKEAVPRLSVIRAESLAARGEISPARQLIDQALARFPEDVELWVASANLAGREKDPAATLAVLDEARRRLGDRTELRLARVEYWASRGDAAVAPLEGLEKEAGSLPGDERARMWRALAAAYLQVGRGEKARQLWRELAEDRPDDMIVLLVLFDQAMGAGDLREAEDDLARLRRIEGEDGPLGHYGRALLLLRRTQREPSDRAPLLEARGELLRAASRRPSWSRIPLILGDIEALKGNLDGAIQEYLRAVVDLGERDASAVAKVLQLLTARGRIPEAAGLVQKLKDERLPLSGELRRMVAQVSSQGGDPARALELAQSVVPADSNNPEELIWLGQIQWAAGKPADPAFRRAAALAPGSPKAWLALILYLTGTGQKDQAEDALKKAEQALSGDRAPLVLAQAHEALGHRDRARELYEGTLRARPDDLAALRATASFLLRDGRASEAQARLERIIELGGATTDARWARRILASLMAGGGPQKALKALEILGLTSAASGAGSGDDPQDLRIKAKILAAQPNRARRREAIAILERLGGRKPVDPDDIYLLALLHESDGNWPKARERLEELVSLRDKNPSVLAHAIRTMLRHNRHEEATAYFVRLEPLAPAAPATIELKARILTARGRGKEAAELLGQLTEGKEARLEPVALLLEELGQVAAAEALFRRLVERTRVRQPLSILSLARFLGRHGRIDEALDLAEGAWATCPPESVADASVAILYGEKAATERGGRVAQRLEGAIRAHPDMVALEFDLANLRILQGRYSDAKAIYRRVSERDKTTGAPLNNLAWLLAMQDGPGADEALALLDRAVELVGETPNLLDTRALARLARGQPELAIRDLEDAIAVSPSATEYFHLARAYEAAARRGEAAQAMQKAKDLGITVEGLHPLERPAFIRLSTVLEAAPANDKGRGADAIGPGNPPTLGR